MSSIFSRNKDFKNVNLKPFCYIIPSINSIYKGMLILLIPQIIMLFLTKSFNSLCIISLTVLGSISAELLYTVWIKTYPFSWISSLLQGILIGMLLPSTYPIIGVFFVTFIVLVITKYAFGGYANSWINPAAIVIAIAYLINLSSFPNFAVTVSDLQSRNAALTVIQNEITTLCKFDTTITEFLNKTIFRIAGVSIPEGYVSLFWDSHSVIPAFRFNLITLLSSIILITFDMIDVIIPTVFLVTYSILIKFIEPIFVNGISCQGDIILALLTSGTLFSTLFILQWFGTTPVSQNGKFVYGFIAGIVAFLVMGCGTSPTGYVFTILIMNLISTMIQVVESKIVKQSIVKKIIPRINLLSEVKYDK